MSKMLTHFARCRPWREYATHLGSVVVVLWMSLGFLLERAESRMLLSLGLGVAAGAFWYSSNQTTNGARPIRRLWATWFALGAALYFLLGIFDPSPSDEVLWWEIGDLFRFWPYLSVPVALVTVDAALGARE